MSLPNPYHQEGAPWAVYGKIPVAASLRYLAHRPKTRRSRSLRRGQDGVGVCGAVRVRVCVRRCGRGSLPASAPCRQTWRHARAFPPWLTNKLHALHKSNCRTPTTTSPLAVYGTIPVAAALCYVAEHAVHEPQAGNMALSLSSVCEACADVPACLRGKPGSGQPGFWDRSGEIVDSFASSNTTTTYGS